MTYLEAVKEKERLEHHVENLSKALMAFPRSPMGLVLDSVKATKEYKQAKAAYDTAFQRLRQFNGLFTKQFKTHRQAARRTIPCAKCGAMLKPHWLKEGVCNGCRNPELIVTALK